MRVEIAAIILAFIWYHVPMSPEQSNCLIPSYFCVKSKMDMNGIVPAFKVLCEYTVWDMLMWGNERVDRLASTEQVAGAIVMNKTEIVKDTHIC